MIGVFWRRDTHRPPGWGLPATRELHRRQSGAGRQRRAGPPV